MTEVEVSKLVSMLLVAYPHAKPSAATAQLYETMLADLDYRATERVVIDIIGTSNFFPTIAEVRQAALEAMRGAVRSGGAAYGDVMLAVRRHGRTYGGEPGPTFSDPLIAECVRVWGGSWNTVCDSPDNDPAGRARFIELYDSLAKRERRTAQTTTGLQLQSTPEVNRVDAGRVVSLLGIVGRSVPGTEQVRARK